MFILYMYIIDYQSMAALVRRAGRHSLLDEDQDGKLSSPLVLHPQLRLSRRSMPFELCWA